MEVRRLPGMFDKKRKRPGGPCCSAVVAAAGSSTRMGEDKLLIPLGDDPVIIHTLRALEVCPLIQEIIVVTREDLIVPLSRLCQEYWITKAAKVVLGGETRTRSVRLGVLETAEDAQLIAVQDGARPLVSQQVLDEVIRAAYRNGAAAPAIPVKDTIKQAENGMVLGTLDRSRLFAVQTPQVFEAGLLRAALHKALEDGAELTDDCAAVERLGMRVTLTQGSEENLKITTPFDLTVAEALLNRRGGL